MATHWPTWSRQFNSIGNKYLTTLMDGFNSLGEEVSIEKVRDSVRTMLHKKDAQGFPMGKAGSCIALLASALFQTEHPIASSQLLCSKCNYEGPEIDNKLGYV